MNEPESSALATLFAQHMRQTSIDRNEQTKQFTGALDGLRQDIRVLGVLALLGILALAGIQVSTSGVTLTPPVAAVTHE
jgi:hypothetical protein